MLLLQASEIEKLARRKRRMKRMKPLRSPAHVERDFQRRLRRLWKEVLFPAVERIQEAVRMGASPEQMADLIEEVLRMAELQYGIEADQVTWRWASAMEQESRIRFQRGLNASLGVDISAVLDTPSVAAALADARKEAAGLIKSIPRDYLGRVAQAVGDNFRGNPLPEGRTLEEQIRFLLGAKGEGEGGEKRARLIARDQTSKLTGTLNRVRQEAIGVEEYVWRTVQDRRVVGNPTGEYPIGNDKHMDHYHREGKRFRWNQPPPDGFPGQAIQCRCWAEPILDAKKILAHSQLG